VKDVEEYLNSVCRNLSAAASLRRHLREELRTHIEEAIAAHQEDGASSEEAVRMAIEEFGDPAMVRDELHGVYGRRLMSLLIDRAMEWKVRTMTSEWKWGFLGQSALMLVMAVQLILILAITVLIMPLAQEHYSFLRVDVPRHLAGMIDVLRFFYQTWYIWVLLILVGAVVFEWRGPKSGKSIIRLGVSATAALVLTVAASAVTAGVMIPLARAPAELRLMKPEPAIFHAVEQAGTLYTHLTREVAAGDWTGVRETARSLRDELRFLSREGAGAPILVGMNRRDDIDDVRQLLESAAELSDDVADSIRNGDQSLTPRHLSDLERTYGRLTALLEG